MLIFLTHDTFCSNPAGFKQLVDKAFTDGRGNQAGDNIDAAHCQYDGEQHIRNNQLSL